MKRSGFTMIELVFVVVILGILAAVVVPKMSSNRDDAKITSISKQISSIETEVPSYFMAKGITNIPLTEASQVLNQMVNAGKAEKVSDANISVYTPDAGNNNVECIDIYYADNNQTLMIHKDSNGSGTTICDNVAKIIHIDNKDKNITISGSIASY